MIPSNFHTHTPRCQHAYGEEREYIENAIKIGMSELGFSDHCPVPFKNDYVSNIRMKMTELDNYVSTLRKLADEYKSDIKIHVGLEMEYLPEYFSKQIQIFNSVGIDYLIMGEHFIEDEQSSFYSGEAFTEKKHLSEYVDTIIEGMKTGCFKYLAHPDLINYTGLDNDFYTREITRLCTTLKQMDIPVEVNGLGLLTNRHYPNQKFWSIASSVGCKAIIGMDAHDPREVANQAIYDACQNIITKNNMTQVFLSL